MSDFLRYRPPREVRFVVFRNQRVGNDGGRSSPRTFKGEPISSLKRPRPLGSNFGGFTKGKNLKHTSSWQDLAPLLYIRLLDQTKTRKSHSSDRKLRASIDETWKRVPEHRDSTKHLERSLIKDERVRE